MKKIMIYALAACATWLAGCSKDAGIDQQVAGEGKYTLPAITASLDDAETRTSGPNATTGAVNWVALDRIAVINTKSKKIYYYVLTSGAGSSVGKFAPDGAAAKFDDIKDIKAVYPAIAASVDESTGAVSVSINTEPTEEKLVQCGITSWTPNSSKYTFSNNDIKVSYNTTMKTTEDAKAQVNFKFRQLATWCNFVFDFTAAKEYELETMEKFVVSSSKAISGTAEIDFSDPNAPKLKANADKSIGTDKSIEWKTTALLDGSFTKSLMLFPAIEGTDNGTKTGDRLQFEITTGEHKLTFYATPSTNLTAGTVLRFPFNVNDNFTKATAVADFKYLAEEINNLPAFYYYGEANCLLVAKDKTDGKIDITPHKTNTYYWNVKEDASAAPKPTHAKVIWKETGITGTIVCTISGNELSVSGVEGYGNALVGIYESEEAMNTDKPLWSYHIWKPEIDPTSNENVLTYNYTHSGTYQVMPIALGATQKTTATADGTTASNPEVIGLYYQWGRKDPMGRPSKFGAGNEDFVAAVDANGAEFKFGDASHEKQLQSILGLASDVTTVETMKLDDKEDGVDVPVDYYMIDYAKDNPTVFIMDGKNINNAGWNWTGKNNLHLWGNPQGNKFPRKEDLRRSIFDPCPAGWRVAPRDLWIAFSKSGAYTRVEPKADDNTSWAENLLNIANIDEGTHETTLTTQIGYFFYYERDPETNGKKWREGLYDFYPASGIRNLTNGNLKDVGAESNFWSGSPGSNTQNTYGGSLYFSATILNPLNSRDRGYGMLVRCVKAE